MAELIAAREEPLVLLATSRGAVDLGVKTAHPDSKVVYLPLDVTSETSIKSLQDKVGREYDPVGTMILNAGGRSIREARQFDVWFRDGSEDAGPE